MPKCIQLHKYSNLKKMHSARRRIFIVCDVVKESPAYLKLKCFLRYFDIRQLATCYSYILYN